MNSSEHFFANIVYGKMREPTTKMAVTLDLKKLHRQTRYLKRRVEGSSWAHTKGHKGKCALQYTQMIRLFTDNN